MARKTISVQYLRDKVNFALANPDRANEDPAAARFYRCGLASVLELALHESGNYRGFGYHNVDHTVDPPVIPDETRRIYY